MSDGSDIIFERVNRHYRQTMIEGDGIYHWGDCNIYGSNICTCGLLHLLLYVAPTHREEVDQLYPKYYEEVVNHERCLGHLRLNMLPDLRPDQIEENERLLKELFPGLRI